MPTTLRCAQQLPDSTVMVHRRNLFFLVVSVLLLLWGAHITGSEKAAKSSRRHQNFWKLNRSGLQKPCFGKPCCCLSDTHHLCHVYHSGIWGAKPFFSCLDSLVECKLTVWSKSAVVWRGANKHQRPKHRPHKPEEKSDHWRDSRDLRDSRDVCSEAIYIS